jgi:small subunit ribosomal protein S8
MAKKRTVEIPHSRMKREVARILKEEGYIQDFSEKGVAAEAKLIIELKYGPDGQRAITGLHEPAGPAGVP